MTIKSECSNVFSRWCPESIHWLVDKGYHEKALRQLQTIAKMNGGKLNEEIYYRKESRDQPSTDSKSTWAEFKDFVKQPKLFLYLVILCYVMYSI